MDNQLKSGIVFTPENSKPSDYRAGRMVLTQSLIDTTQDAIWLIEEKRLEKIKMLRAMAIN